MSFDDDADFFDELISLETPSQASDKSSVSSTMVVSPPRPTPMIQHPISHSQPTSGQSSPNNLNIHFPRRDSLPPSFSNLSDPSRPESVSRRQSFSRKPPSPPSHCPPLPRSSLPVCVSPNGRIFVGSSVITEFSLPSLLSRTPLHTSLSTLPSPVIQQSKSAVAKYFQETISSTKCPTRELLLSTMSQIFENHGEISDELITSITQILQASTAPDLSPPQSPLSPPNPNTIEHLLLQGDHVSAIKTACDEGNWAHALLLSFHSRDSILYKQVVKSFIESNISPGKPLRTLYSMFLNESFQFMFGPDSSFLVDNWRNNLLVTLINRAPNTNNVVKSIGDGLIKNYEANGDVSCLSASHLCWLLSGEGVTVDLLNRPTSSFGGKVSVKTTEERIGLIGCDVSSSFCWSDLVSGIQLTEIFEFSKYLNNSQYKLNDLLSFKLGMVAVLSDFGLVKSATRLLQSIQSDTRHLSPADVTRLPETFKNRLDSFTNIYSCQSVASQSGSILGGIFGLFKRSESSNSQENSRPSTQTSDNDKVVEDKPAQNSETYIGPRKPGFLISKIRQILNKDDEFTPIHLQEAGKMVFTQGVGWHKEGELPKKKASIPPPPPMKISTPPPTTVSSTSQEVTAQGSTAPPPSKFSVSSTSQEVTAQGSTAPPPSKFSVSSTSQEVTAQGSTAPPPSKFSVSSTSQEVTAQGSTAPPPSKFSVSSTSQEVTAQGSTALPPPPSSLPPPTFSKPMAQSDLPTAFGSLSVAPPPRSSGSGRRKGRKPMYVDPLASNAL
ncbi:hypothetical protein P9112_008672 [Eukaryota sp. TZLM1-RC]